MFTSTKLYHELRNFRKEIEQFKNSTDYIESYYFHDPNGKTFDADGLKDHLRENPIKNDFAYKDIYMEADKIVDLHNTFETKTLKPWNSNLIQEKQKKGTFYSTTYIQAISTLDGKFIHHRYLDIFIAEYEYQHFTFDKVAHICHRILNILHFFGHNQKKPLDKKEEPAKRIDIGILFLTGQADKMYEDLKSWRKVAKHFNLDKFHGQFSATAKKENKANNGNDVFITHKKGIMNYIENNKIEIDRQEYLSQQ